MVRERPRRVIPADGTERGIGRERGKVMDTESRERQKDGKKESNMHRQEERRRER